MRKSRVLLAGVAVAAAAAATSAFTASNTVPQSVAGYGQAAVTGATVTNVHYVADTADASLLGSVVFTVTTDVTNAATRTMVLRTGVNASTNAGGTVVGSPYNCTVTTAWDAAATPPNLLLTCLTADKPAFTAFDGVGLTVVQ
jgi:uncharacterized protein YdeI (BOF family)